MAGTKNNTDFNRYLSRHWIALERDEGRKEVQRVGESMTRFGDLVGRDEGRVWLMLERLDKKGGLAVGKWFEMQ